MSLLQRGLDVAEPGRMRIAVLLVLVTGCTLGVEQSFELAPGPGVTDHDGDELFELTNRGGNTPEELSVYRVVIDDVELGGGWFGRGDKGDALVELEVDGGEPGIVEPGDVLRVRELSDRMQLDRSLNGTTKWINVMVVDPSQRGSDAL